MKKWLAAGMVTLALPVAAAASTAAGASPARASTGCAAGAACTMGAWQVMPSFPKDQVRAARAVLMYTGNVLLVAGSGDDTADFNARTFKTAVYDPSKGTITQIPAPADFNRAGQCSCRTGRCSFSAAPRLTRRRLTGTRGSTPPTSSTR